MLMRLLKLLSLRLFNNVKMRKTEFLQGSRKFKEKSNPFEGTKLFENSFATKINNFIEMIIERIFITSFKFNFKH